MTDWEPIPETSHGQDCPTHIPRGTLVPSLVLIRLVNTVSDALQDIINEALLADIRQLDMTSLHVVTVPKIYPKYN